MGEAVREGNGPGEIGWRGGGVKERGGLGEGGGGGVRW